MFVRFWPLWSLGLFDIYAICIVNGVFSLKNFHFMATVVVMCLVFWFRGMMSLFPTSLQPLLR